MPFSKIYDSDNKSFCLNITITLKDKTAKEKFRVWAEDRGKVNSKYADREICVDENGTRTIYFSFVVSPKQLFIGVVNINDPNDNMFEVTFMESPLKTYNIQIDDQTHRFLQFSLNFSQTCGFENASPYGREFVSNPKEFLIKYFPVITDRMSGTPLNTPARIGHETGNIDVAKNKFDNYTIPMRMMILLHEYCHKFRNPKMGLEISNEKGADVNALFIYLSIGFSKIDAITVFTQVFRGAQTDGNRSRCHLIMDYIKRFEDEEFVSKN